MARMSVAMARQEPPPRRRNTGAAILEAAEHLLTGVDASEVRVEDIAMHAGTSVGSIYVHFKSKDGLYLHVVDRALQRSRQVSAGRAPQSSPLERVIAAGEAYLEFALAFPGALRVLEEHRSGTSVGDIPPEIEHRIRSRIDEEIAVIRADLAEAMAIGEIVTLPIDDVLLGLWAAWDGVVRMSLINDHPGLDEAALRRILSGAARVLARGLRPDG